MKEKKFNISVVDDNNRRYLFNILNDLGKLLNNNDKKTDFYIFDNLMLELKKDIKKDIGFFVGYKIRFFNNVLIEYLEEQYFKIHNKKKVFQLEKKHTKKLTRLLNNSRVLNKSFDESKNIQYI